MKESNTHVGCRTAQLSVIPYTPSVTQESVTTHRAQDTQTSSSPPPTATPLLTPSIVHGVLSALQMMMLQTHLTTKTLSMFCLAALMCTIPATPLATPMVCITQNATAY